MNARTLLLNALLGVVTGVGILVTLRQPAMCCCGTPGLLLVGTLAGSGLAPLLHGHLLRAGAALGYGALHGLLLGLLASGTFGFGLMALTSDATFKEAARTHAAFWREIMDRVEEQIEETSSTGNGASEDRAEREERRKQMREQREQMEKAIEAIEEDPETARLGILITVGISAGAAALLLGCLGGYLGSIIFRRRLQEGAPAGETPDPDRARMKMPEQPRPWWEDE